MVASWANFNRRHPQDFLWRPEFFEPGSNNVSKDGVGEFAWLGTLSPLASPLVGRPDSIVLTPPVGFDFPAHRLRWADQVGRATAAIDRSL